MELAKGKNMTISILRQITDLFNVDYEIGFKFNVTSLFLIAFI